MSVGYLGHMGLKQETSFGTEATPPVVFGEIFNESISMDNRFIRPETVNGTRFRKWAFPGPISAQGGISMALWQEGLVPWLFKGLFGQVSSEQVADGVYDHTFIPLQSSRLPSFTAQVDHEAACQNWIGCTVSGATISVSPSELLDFSVDLLAQRPKKSDPASPVYYDVAPCRALEAEFTLNGVPNVNFEDFSLTFSNAIEPVWTLNGKRHAARHVAKGFELEGRMTIEFGSDEERRRMWGGPDATEPLASILPGSLNLAITQTEAFTGDYHRKITIDVPEIFYSAAPANIRAAKDRIIQSVVFFANFNSAASKLVDVVVRNSEAGYPNP